MPRINIDFSAGGSFDVLPEGQYEATIDEIRYRDARAEGKFPQLAVVMTIAEGEFTGRKAFQNLSLSPAAMWRMANFFNLFGLEEQGADGLDYDEDTKLVTEPDLSGEPVRIKIKHRMWQGEVQADVTVVEAYNAPAQAETPPPAAPQTRRATASPAPARRVLR